MSAKKALLRYDSNLTSYPAIDKVRKHGIITINCNIVRILIARAAERSNYKKFKHFDEQLHSTR